MRRFVFVWIKLRRSGVNLVEKNMERLNQLVLNASDVSPGDQYSTGCGNGAPLQSSGPVMADRWPDGAECHSCRQMIEQFGNRLRDGLVALHRSITLVQLRIRMV